jgi:hypothetical protein
MVMKIKQLSLFMENQSGKLRFPCKVLADAGIDILTLSLADTQQFGILRLIVDDWEKAKKALETAGCVVKVTEVVAVEVKDRPGGLAEILEILEGAQINIEYMYAFTFGKGDRAVLIFRFEDSNSAISVLESKGVNLVAQADLQSQKEKC